jgi:hypothetical protein
MTENQSLIDTLYNSRTVLSTLRRSIANGGHLEAMGDFDALIGVAQDEAKRCLATAIRRQCASQQTDALRLGGL